MNNTQKEQIQRLLGDPTCKVDDILEIFSCMYLFTQSMPQLVRFFIDHAHDLIVAALGSENATVQMRSYAILTSDNSIFREAALLKGEIANVFQEYLESDNPSKVTIFRIAYVMQICFMDFIDDSCEQFWFVHLLVRHFDVSAVVDLFKHLVGEGSDADKFMEWLFTLDIDQKIMEVIEDLHTKPEKDWEFVIGLYDVLDAFLRREKMLARFIAPNRISLLTEPLEDAPLYVVDRHCKLLFDIVNEYTAPFIAQQISLFSKYLQNTSAIHCDFVWAMKIMMRMLETSPAQVKGFDLNVLVEAAFTVLSSFQEHSIGLNEACNCLYFLAQQPGMRDEIVDRFVMVAQFAFERQQTTSITSFCYQLMKRLAQGTDWTNYDKQDFDALYSNYVVPMDAIIDQDYGGQIEGGIGFPI